MRSLRLDGMKFRINEKSVFQRLVLDQGFYPDGIYTAPTDEELRKDVERSMAVGFNGARLHEKIFEERFLYHCDQLGYIVWGEFPNWGLDISYADSIYGILPEWIEELERDFLPASISDLEQLTQNTQAEEVRTDAPLQATRVMEPVGKAEEKPDLTRTAIHIR